ncbi:hypothetical protein [Micromonospora sp. URMC 103]|uniref:hypothetical protein n=1 Tax=Micromonospora sp. URMC 103 TaxID=3423406 RepID=UPI003F1A8492
MRGRPLGRVAARLLAQRVIAIAPLATNAPDWDAAAEVRAVGSRALSVEVEMADYDQVVAAGQQVEDELGPMVALDDPRGSNPIE